MCGMGGLWCCEEVVKQELAHRPALGVTVAVTCVELLF
jgi:hypothetical protein